MPEITVEKALQLAIQNHTAGQLQQADLIYAQILAHHPQNVDAMRLRGVIAAQMGRLDEALELLCRARSIKPELLDVYVSLGDVYKHAGRLDEAEETFRAGLRLRPDHAELHNRLALILQDRGQLVDAIAELETALSLNPNMLVAHDRLLLLLHCHPDSDMRSIFEEHRRWNDRFAAPLKQFIRPHRNSLIPERRLRIGYLSQDFCQQPLATFVLPLLRSHDRRQVQIVGYAEVTKPDMLTEDIRRQCDEWRFTPSMSDEQLAAQITADGIDIMVDLSLHSVPNRLLALARKPAPVQVTYLGYCSTTGMDTIDYRLTDPYLDPPGSDDAFYSEKSFRLPETYWCYKPLIETPLTELPAARAGFVTFGCLNNFVKLSAPTKAMFARLMKAVPNSKLILHAREGMHRQRVQNELQNQGIDPARLRFVGYVPLHEYFNVYQQIDIALDPFPWGGGTTTLDAIWVGVPVVTLRGRLAVGRGGVSILSNVGLTDLIANSVEEYESIATRLAGDFPRLTQLRGTLRQSMQNSPLTNTARFTRNIELAYRQMWRTYCMEMYRRR